MKVCLFAVGLIVVAGCNNQAEPAAADLSPTPSKAAPQASADSVPLAAPSTTANQTKNKFGFNPKRLYQLYDLKKTKLVINGHTLDAWVMDTDNLREEGMMFLKDKDFGPDQAMIFVFPQPKEQSFWMHNTLVPLDIAYIGADKKVVRATSMKALDESSVPSNGPAQYALEMKVGTNDRLHITKGTPVSMSADVKTSE